MDRLIEALLSASWRKLVLSVGFVLLTALVVWTYFAKLNWRLDAFFFAFDLGSERNFAVWGMSALLLLCSLSFYEFFVRRLAGHRAPWLVLSSLFLLFSWDEVGSLHERNLKFEISLQLVPILMSVGALGAAALYAVCRLIARHETRTSGWLLFFAFFLYGSIPVQEFLEHNVRWPFWSTGLRLGVEEGTEVAATFLALWAVAAQRSEIRDGSLPQILPDTRVFAAIRPVLFGLLIAHCAVSLVYVPHLDLSLHGNPGIWYPAAIYVLLACHILRRIRDPKQGRVGLWGGLALFLLACSTLIVIRFDDWWPGMTITRLLPTDFYVVYAYQFAFMGAFLAGLGLLGRRTLPLYAAVAVLPLIVRPQGDPVATAIVLGVSAYLYAEILYLAEKAERATGTGRALGRDRPLGYGPGRRGLARGSERAVPALQSTGSGGGAGAGTSMSRTPESGSPSRRRTVQSCQPAR